MTQARTLIIICSVLLIATCVSILYIDKQLTIFIYHFDLTHIPFHREFISFFNIIGTRISYYFIGLCLWLLILYQYHFKQTINQRLCFVFIALAATTLLASALTIVFARYNPRMFFVTQLYGFNWFDNKPYMGAFPSGHISRLTGLCTSLCLAWPRRQWIFISLGVLLVLCIGISKILILRHFISDELMGILIGLLVPYYIMQLVYPHGVDNTMQTATNN